MKHAVVEGPARPKRRRACQEGGQILQGCGGGVGGSGGRWRQVAAAPEAALPIVGAPANFLWSVAAVLRQTNSRVVFLWLPRALTWDAMTDVALKMRQIFEQQHLQ